MKNLVLCVLNSKYIHSSLAPWYLSASVKRLSANKINVSVLEGTINENSDSIITRIIERRPDIIGFSVYIWNRIQTFAIIKRLRELLPETVIFVGGPEVSYDAQNVLFVNSAIDFCVSGEGEHPVAMLVDSIIKGEKAPLIDGVSYILDGKAIINEPYITEEEPPCPYTDEYFLALSNRIAYLETSRGCPYSCDFCLSGGCGGVRFFDLDKAKENMLLLANKGAKTIKLIDRTFNADKKRAKEIFSFIIENYGTKIPVGVCFHFEIAGDILDEETLSLLSKAPKGAIQFEIGIQSFNEKTLSAINRKTNLKKLEENISFLLKNNNIHIHIDLIAGLPYEDYTSFKHSFNRAYKLGADMLQLSFLKLLHGTPLRDSADVFGYIYSEKPPYEVISTPYISHSELSELHEAELALDKLYNSGRFKEALNFLFKNNIYDPYELFLMVGKHIKMLKKEHCSLDELTNTFYTFIEKDERTDIKVFRDKLIIDRLSSCSTGVIPEKIRIRDKRLSQVKRYLESKEEHRVKKGVKRSIAILYSENSAIYADYSEADVKNGRFELHKIKLDKIY